jgi:hypothetical protein
MPITVMVPNVVPRGMIVVPAMVVAVPPAARLSLGRDDECASEKKYDDRARDDLHTIKNLHGKTGD